MQTASNLQPSVRAYSLWEEASGPGVLPPTLCSFPVTSQVLVAAFAVSGYCSTYFRAGSKPFNPVLGETYECIREDKGFRFFSEQVSEVAVQGWRSDLLDNHVYETGYLTS